ncbi:hypothetical protein AVEN_22886-1 [Araneus ventricosus]|uniref:Uncharacterized protein n=1 Tax=Araneus ventricosus TaxID=182803 RepID=A0A4Y2VHU7_ARAVE|nr:hypothetical protein AVEN_22886-1 [Araneus ventricosus]
MSYHRAVFKRALAIDLFNHLEGLLNRPFCLSPYKGGGSWTFHHRSVPIHLEGFLSRSFPFSAHKIRPINLMGPGHFTIQSCQSIGDFLSRSFPFSAINLVDIVFTINLSNPFGGGAFASRSFPFQPRQNLVDLDIHHRPISSGGLLSRLFYYLAHKIEWGPELFTIDLFNPFWRAFLADLFHFQPIKFGGSWTFTIDLSNPFGGLS